LFNTPLYYCSQVYTLCTVLQVEAIHINVIGVHIVNQSIYCIYISLCASDFIMTLFLFVLSELFEKCSPVLLSLEKRTVLVTY